MFRPDRTALRSAGLVVLLTGVFLIVNTQVVYAASSTSETGDLLAPLNITSSEGVPINGYDLGSSGGSIINFKGQALAFALSGLFTLIRLLVGLAGWAIEVALRFPLLKILSHPAERIADTYDSVVVDTLGLKGLLLAWAFVFAGFMIVRGRVGRGLGEIFLTLLIGAIAASALIRPDTLLGQDGPLGQAQQVAAEVAQQSVASYDWGGKIATTDPCAGMAGNAELKCLQREDDAPVSAEDVARPLQDSITNALIVKPFMLLEYGRILDPSKKSDLKAYAVHLKWVAGGYKTSGSGSDGSTADCDSLAKPQQKYCEEQNKKTDACSLIHGPARQYCEEGSEENIDHCAGIDGPGKQLCESSGDSGGLPGLTSGSDLLSASTAITSEDDQEFAAFLADMKNAGDVGKACAAYAEEPTWWRVGGALLLLIAALFICGMLLSSAIVLLGTQGVCVGAAAVGGVTFVAGMLPGPARQSVWKWLSLWGIAIMAVVAISAFIPFFGIAIDATVTNGPDLMVERILLIDVLAIAGAAGHRRLLTTITSFGQRMAMRMRYAKVGGTHMPGDTSELGAALAMNSPAALGGYGGGLRLFAGGGRFGRLGTRQRLMGALASLVDGAGMPVDTGGILADATAEAGRGLAPLTAAAAIGGLGARLGLRGAYGLLIGSRPNQEQLARWVKPTADGDGQPGGPNDGGGPNSGRGGGGPLRPGGPPDRYRNEDGQIANRRTGEVLHDQNTDRTLLTTRAHNGLVRYRGYRILNRSGRAAYGASYGLPGTVRQVREGRSRFTQDARQQLQIWGNTVREDGRAWGDAGRHVGRTMRDHADDRGGVIPFTRRLSTPVVPPAPPSPAAGRSSQPTRRSGPLPAPSVSPRSAPVPPHMPAAGAGSGPTAPPVSPTRLQGGAPRRRPVPGGPGAVLPGGGNVSGSTREEARRRFQELLRRTAADAELLRQEQEQPPEDGESE
ncbi:hypothetical protein ACFWPQ_40965 [Streptomyces sp. NPDC058464]|uniref:hypothetical protein n=1 Tax=Streptomyces sp. NPDC058464 TaxID=3346511 RepID=UPI003656B1F6